MTYHYLYVIGQRGLGFRRLALRLEALSTQVQRLSRERDVSQLTRDDLSLLLQRYSTASTVLTHKQSSRITSVTKAQMWLIVLVHTVWFTFGFLCQLQTGPARLSPLGGEGAEESVSEARPARPPPSPSVSHTVTT